MLQWEHSAILSTFIKLLFVIKILVLSIFEWLLKTGFTVLVRGMCYGMHFNTLLLYMYIRERSGSVVECLTRDRRVAGLSLTGVTALWSLSKTHLS